jgi:hypothetical protein
LAEARKRLDDALKNLKELRKKQEEQGLTRSLFPGMRGPDAPMQWGLALDELQETGMEIRPRLPWGKKRRITGPSLAPLAGTKAGPLSDLLGPLKLDPLTVADDRDFLDLIERERNLPKFVQQGLRGLYPA